MIYNVFITAIIQQKEKKCMKEKMTKMSLFEKISYGFGNMGLCLATTMVTSFLMFFYSDIVKLSLGQVGTIMLLGGIADAISDPLMGIFIDRTNTKWGKSRPYLLFFAIPMAIITTMVFKVPEGSEAFRYGYALVTYILYTLAYTAICIPQNVLITSITDDQKDRLEVNMFGTLGTTIAQFAVGAIAVGAVAALGNGSSADGYFRTSMIFCVIGALCILVCFRFTHERINPPANVKVTAKDIFTGMKNRPWIICAVTSLCMIAAIVVRATSTMYFTTNILNNPGIASTLLSITSIVGIPLALLTPIIAPKFGKRNIVIFGAVLSILGSVAMHFSTHSTVLVIVCTVIIAVGLALPGGVIYVMTAEAVDFGEWKTGVRIGGFLMAIVGFGVKIANSVATMLCSNILAYGGYVGGAEVQTASAKIAIEVNYLLIPIILSAIMLIVMCFYDLDKKFPEIRAELMERRQKEMDK